MDARKPSGCLGCPLAEAGRGFVPGHGNPRLPWWVGEAPGKDEVREGNPFVGASGVEREKALRHVGSHREAWYTTNVLKCQPPKEWSADKQEARYRPLWAQAM